VNEPLAQAIQSRRQQAGNESRGIDRKVDRGPKDSLLRAEVVKDERRVDTRVGRDAADRTRVVANPGEWARAAARIISPVPPRPDADQYEASR